jgi:uncharacterized membrane protein
MISITNTLSCVAQDEGFRTPESLFSWHPISMLAATACVYPAAFDAVTMRFQAKGVAERRRLLTVHACLQLAAATVLIAGFAAIYMNKPPGKHFLTLHSWVGAVAMATCVMNAFYGVAKSARFLQLPRLQWTDEGHRSLGYISFIALIVACKLGLYNKVFCFLFMVSYKATRFIDHVLSSSSGCPSSERMGRIPGTS